MQIDICTPYYEGSPGGVVANEFFSDIVLSEFKLMSDYYDHFRTNTLRKGMNPFISLAIV